MSTPHYKLHTRSHHLALAYPDRVRGPGDVKTVDRNFPASIPTFSVRSLLARAGCVNRSHREVEFTDRNGPKPIPLEAHAPPQLILRALLNL